VEPQLSERRLAALHEAAHAAAALLLGREVGTLRIDANGNGRASVGLLLPALAAGAELEETLDDVTILLAGTVVAERTEPRDGFGLSTDQQRALAAARQATGTGPEAAALVQLGMARAMRLAGREDFIKLTERLAAALEDAGELGAVEIRELTKGAR
jgi:hypothetical protein